MARPAAVGGNRHRRSLTKLGDILESARAEVEALSREEARVHFDRWCKAFCHPVKVRTGRYRYKGFHWHAFSWGVSRAESGDRAFQLYRAERESTLLVIPEEWSKKFVGYRVTVTASPDLTRSGLDLYVFPESADWTMAFTHEQPWLGPYFSRREWCTTPTARQGR